MRCRALKKWVWRYGAAELPSSLAAHLDGCEACRELTAEVRSLDLALVQDPTPDPGEAYWENFALRLARRLEGGSQPVISLTPGPIGWGRWVRRWVPIVGVAVLAVLMGRTVIEEQTPGIGSESDVPLRSSSLSEIGPGATDLSDGVSSSHGLESQEVVAPSTAARQSDRLSVDALTPAARIQSGSDAAALESPDVIEYQSLNEPRESGMVAGGQSETVPPDDGGVWPERQVISLGEVSADTPSQLSGDKGRLAEQGSYGSFERRMAYSGLASETAGVHHMPGRLLEGPRLHRPRGFTDVQSPAEAMRRFDEVRELRVMIGELQSVPVGMRGENERTRLSTLWYRLGTITAETVLLDSAIQVLNEYIETLPTDAGEEWSSRRDQLLDRRESLN